MIERILYNGNVITMDPQQPHASALAIRDERIVAVGSDNDVLALATAGTRRENLDGATVIPGLTDAHIHFEWLARALHAVDLFEVPTYEEAAARVKAYVEKKTFWGDWITGRGWTQDKWDGQFPTAAVLDPVSGPYPAFLQAKHGHAAWVNTAALERCGITDETPDPPGGHIMRDENGHATGIMLERAIELIAPHVPKPPLHALADYMLSAQDVALRAGLTGIHDYDEPSCMGALQVVRERGKLGLRIYKNFNHEWLEHVLEVHLRWGFGDDWIRFGGLKIFADGAMGPRTASMIEPYCDNATNYGMIVTDQETMYDMVSRASAAGLPSTIHAIGDRAVREVLNVYEMVRREEAARGQHPSQLRHRVEHVQIIHPDDIPRFSELNVIASMQPVHILADWQVADLVWGERARWSYNSRVQIDQGVVVAFGSDCPVEPIDPLRGIYAAVTRRQPGVFPDPQGWYPEWKLTTEEALRGYTYGPAYTSGREDRLGMLRAGYLADLVLLDRDLMRVEPDEILDITVLGTMVGGQWRYGGIG